MLWKLGPRPRASLWISSSQQVLSTSQLSHGGYLNCNYIFKMCHHIHCHQLIIYGCGTQPKRWDSECKFVLFDLSPSKIKIASRLKARRRTCNLQNKMRKVSITPKVLDSIYNFAAAADAINKLCAPSLSLRNKRFLIQCLRRRTINENPGLKLHLLQRVF